MSPIGQQSSEAFRTACLKKTWATLLVERRWRYLRYLHAREAFALVSHDIDSVLAIGVGKGLAELALAIEYPHVHFHLTDIESATTPNWSFVQRAVSEWNLTNVEFDMLDIRQPPSVEADMVCSTEVLEHIEQFDKAAANMLAAARKYVFALVPFADRRYNADPVRRQRVLDTHGHYVCGFDRSALVDLFPDAVEIRGCYWTDQAHKRTAGAPNPICRGGDHRSDRAYVLQRRHVVRRKTQQFPIDRFVVRAGVSRQ